MKNSVNVLTLSAVTFPLNAFINIILPTWIHLSYIMWSTVAQPLGYIKCECHSAFVCQVERSDVDFDKL